MELTLLRNATTLLSFGAHRLLIDPMLSEPGSMPGFKVVGGGRRANPLVPLPPGHEALLASVTGVLITHEHPDHLDAPGLAWIKSRGLPVWASEVDTPNLRRKGVDVRELREGAFGAGVEVIPSRHGRGWLGWLMGPVSGFYLAPPGEPGLYITGDSVLTPEVEGALERLRPDLLLAPAGSANMGVGGDILFSVEELVELARRAPGRVVFNHLEALDHCPTTRDGLRRRIEAEGLGDRVSIPQDGERLGFDAPAGARAALRRPPTDRRPGLQKWLTARFAGT